MEDVAAPLAMDLTVGEGSKELLFKVLAQLLEGQDQEILLPVGNTYSHFTQGAVNGPETNRQSFSRL